MLTLVEQLLSAGTWCGVVLPSEGPLTRALGNLGAACRILPLRWWCGNQDDVKAIKSSIVESTWELKSIVDDWQPDVIYSNTTVIPHGAFVAAMTGKPHVWHVREMCGGDAIRYLADEVDLRRFVNANSNLVIYNSKAVHDDWTKESKPHCSLVAYNQFSTGRPEPVDTNANHQVDVIIPFYNDPMVLECVDSLLAHRTRTLRSIRIYDDVSTREDVIAQIHRRVASHPDLIIYRRNSQNQGFVRNCNHAILESQEDIVLLNSDTRVTAGWLDEMADVAHSEPDIATVTPSSNNASLVSLPERYKNNSDRAPEETASLIRRLTPDRCIELPTAHGFCMYIRRNVIDQLGVFDPAFGKGYGEENDFSRRACRAGYKNVAACRAYVYHAGARSFGSSERERRIKENLRLVKQRYPDYRRALQAYNEADPLRAIEVAMRAQRSAAEPHGCFRVALVAAFVRWKRQTDAVFAVKRLLDQGRNLQLILCGPFIDVAYVDQLKRDCEDIGLAEHVYFSDYVPNPAGIYRLADVCVVCSLREPFGRTTVEALLEGTPVIGAAGGGTTEIVVDGENGRLYTPGCVEELARCLEELMDSPALHSQLSKNAPASVKRFTDPALQAATILEGVGKCLSQESPGRLQGSFLEAALANRESCGGLKLLPRAMKRVLQEFVRRCRHGVVRSGPESHIE